MKYKVGDKVEYHGRGHPIIGIIIDMGEGGPDTGYPNGWVDVKYGPGKICTINIDNIKLAYSWLLPENFDEF